MLHVSCYEKSLRDTIAIKCNGKPQEMGLYIPSDSPSCRLTSAPVSQKIQTCFQLPEAPQLLRKFLQKNFSPLYTFNLTALQNIPTCMAWTIRSPACMGAMSLCRRAGPVRGTWEVSSGVNQLGLPPASREYNASPLTQQPILALGLFLSRPATCSISDIFFVTQN